MMGAEADHVYDLLVFTMNVGAEVSALIAWMERSPPDECETHT